jgi:hypothetical protein
MCAGESGLEKERKEKFLKEGDRERKNIGVWLKDMKKRKKERLGVGQERKTV